MSENYTPIALKTGGECPAVTIQKGDGTWNGAEDVQLRVGGYLCRSCDNNTEETRGGLCYNAEGIAFVRCRNTDIIKDRATTGSPMPRIDDLDVKVEEDAINPEHYKQHPSGVECITITRHMTFNIGNTVKYCWRNGLKDGNPSIQELKKAAWYLDDEIKRLEDVNKV